jgi:prepilin-type processing-associated H-X9-DG protein
MPEYNHPDPNGTDDLQTPEVATPGHPETSRMAVASLVLAILGCTAPLAVILGIVALVQINKEPDRWRGKNYAIAGIVIAGILMLMAPIFFAIALPAYLSYKQQPQARPVPETIETQAQPDMPISREPARGGGEAVPSPGDARRPPEPTVPEAVSVPPADVVAEDLMADATDKAHRSACLSNIKQIGLALAMYNVDYDRQWAPADRWCDCTMPYIRNDLIYRCAAAQELKSGYTYSELMDGIRTSDITTLQTKIAAFDGAGGWNVFGDTEDVRYRHLDDANVVFADGHANWMDEDTLTHIWEEESTR